MWIGMVFRNLNLSVDQNVGCCEREYQLTLPIFSQYFPITKLKTLVPEYLYYPVCLCGDTDVILLNYMTLLLLLLLFPSIVIKPF